MVAGFSLLELMTVVALVGVLTAVAVPNITEAIRKSRARAQFYELRTFLVEARNRARLHRRCVLVEVGASAQELRARESDCAGTHVGARVASFSSLVVEAPSGALHFGTKGELLGGEIVTLQARARGALPESRTLRVLPAIGSVRWQ